MQTFRELREQDCYYVDKTPYIQRLLDEGKHYFLSRPRRFGKSLFLDTLKELFEGSEELFAGLHIHAGHDWSQRHPVVRLSFGGGSFTEPANINTSVLAQLEAVAEGEGVSARYATAPERFAHLLRTLHTQTGQRVAVLVDEYDKPILDMLEEREVARANRDYLRGLYGVIKDNDAHVRFTFLTGISKFSKVNLFSQLNNLTDITLDPAYSSICGYTEDDLDTVFAPELGGLDREQVREWYNGYSWRGADKVYNPFDVLLLLRRHEFEAHWFETGTPAFLVDTLFERRVSTVSVGDMVSTGELLSAFDVNHIGTEALLFQTGYLTITGEERLGGKALYRLGYPNREVRQSLNDHLLRHLVQDSDRQTANSIRLARLLEAHDLRRPQGPVPRLLRQHSVPMVHQQPHRRLRRLLRQRVLLLLRRPRLRRRGGGIEQPRAPGHGRAHRRPRVPVRVQGRRDGAPRFRPRPVAAAPLRRQVPRHRRADPPDRVGKRATRRVQPRHPQPHRLRRSRRLSPLRPPLSVAGVRPLSTPAQVTARSNTSKKNARFADSGVDTLWAG